ncbi:MAG: glycosyltransferase [Bacilli bacterium]
MRFGRITVCILTQDDEQWIDRCLNSVFGLFDEIIVVDLGSTDETVKKVERYGLTVHRFTWTGSYSEVRNYALGLATLEWVFWLDGEEELDPSAIPLMNTLRIGGMPDASICECEVRNYYGETFPPATDSFYAYWQIRLHVNNPQFYFVKNIHEQLVSKQEAIADVKRARVHFVVHHYGYVEEVCRRKEKSERKLQLIEKDMQEEPDNPWHYYYLAGELYRLGRFTEAKGAIAKCIVQALRLEERPSPLFYQMKYAILYAYKDYAGAKESIESVIALYPDTLELWYYRGVIHFELGLYAEALQHFQHLKSLAEKEDTKEHLHGVSSFLTDGYIEQCMAKMEQIVEGEKIGNN